MSAKAEAVAGTMLHVTGTADVMVCFSSEHITARQAAVMRERLEARFPGFNFTFVAGVSGVMVAQR